VTRAANLGKETPQQTGDRVCREAQARYHAGDQDGGGQTPFERQACPLGPWVFQAPAECRQPDCETAQAIEADIAKGDPASHGHEGGGPPDRAVERESHAGRNRHIFQQEGDQHQRWQDDPGFRGCGNEH
jgi:hypothetical protein